MPAEHADSPHRSDLWTRILHFTPPGDSSARWRVRGTGFTGLDAPFVKKPETLAKLGNVSSELQLGGGHIRSLSPL